MFLGQPPEGLEGVRGKLSAGSKSKAEISKMTREGSMEFRVHGVFQTTALWKSEVRAAPPGGAGRSHA